MNFKVGFTDNINKVAAALQQGLIDSGDLIIIKDATDLEGASFAFITDNQEVIQFAATKVANQLQITKSDGSVIATFDGSESVQLNASDLGAATSEEVEALEATTTWINF